MSLAASKNRLRAITTELSLQWAQTKDHWKDAKSLEFEQKFLSDLLPRVDKAVFVIEQLDAVLKKAQSDCE